MEKSNNDKSGHKEGKFLDNESSGESLPESIEEVGSEDDQSFLNQYSNYILVGFIGIVLLGIFIYAFTTSNSESSSVLTEVTVASEETGLIHNNLQFNSNFLLYNFQVSFYIFFFIR